MKKLLFFLLVVPALAGIAVFYSPTSPGVSNQVYRVARSVDSPQYEGQMGVLVLNYEEPLLTNAINLLKVDGTNIVLLTQQEIDTIIATNAAIQVAAELAERQLSERIAKTNALASIDDLYVDGRILKALAEVTMDEINILRAQHSLAPRTLTQLKNAIRNKLESQADSQ